MINLRTIAEAEQALLAFMPSDKRQLTKDMTVGRMKRLMDHLGNPQERLRVIHLAGTSGKTSTAYYVSGLLGQAGQRVGLTVSPHVDSLTERVQINLVPLDDAIFCQALSRFLELVEGFSPKPTYFELLIAFAYWYFEQTAVDYAVIETGIGGLQDATNVVSRADKVCVITDIGLDHTAILGNTIGEIAFQKAGIIQPKNQVFMHQQPREAQTVFDDIARQKTASLQIVADRTNDDEELALFQRRNWSLAAAAYWYVQQRDALPALSSEQLTIARRTYVPGRMDAREVGGKMLVMDGAHNPQKMKAFVSSLQAGYAQRQKAAVLLSVKHDKNYHDLLLELLPITERLIVTTFVGAQDTVIQAANPEMVADDARSCGFGDIHVQTNRHQAYLDLLASDQKLLVITGSIYLLGKIRAEEGWK